MNKEELKNRLHKYIEEASEDELEDLMAFCEGEIEYEKALSSVWDDPEFVREMDRRMEEIANGTVIPIPYEEAMSELRARIEERKRKDVKGQLWSGCVGRA